MTIMPPSVSNSGKYRALPIVTRLSYSDGVAPYNGTVAVALNSRVVTVEEYYRAAYEQAAKECEEMAGLFKATASIRIDVKRLRKGSKFALFDVDLKPVRITGYTDDIQRPNLDIEYDRPRATWPAEPSQLDSNGSKGSWLDIRTSAPRNLSSAQPLTALRNTRI